MATIDMGNFWVNKGQVDSLGDLEDGVEQADITNIEAADLKSDSKLVTVAGSAPTGTAGRLWHDTNDAFTGGPGEVLKVYSADLGASGQYVGLAQVVYSTTAPSSDYEDTGILWYDATLHLWRTYRSGSLDLHGVAGWHPVHEGYQLWTNDSGGTVEANRVVIQDTDAGERLFTTTAIEKDQRVIGVMMEQALAGETKVVAMVAGGMVVDVYVDGNHANGTVAKGDYLIANGVVKEARSGGLSQGNHNSQTSAIIGEPLGSFAVALAAQTGDGLVAARLLGHVGTGAIAYRSISAIYTHAAPSDGTYVAVDCSATTSGSGTQNAAGTALLTAKHLPISAASIEAQIVATVSSAPGSYELNFSKDGVTPNAGGKSIGGTAEDIAFVWGVGPLVTSIGSGTAASNVAPGNKVFVKPLFTNTSAETLTLYIRSYNF